MSALVSTALRNSAASRPTRRRSLIPRPPCRHRAERPRSGVAVALGWLSLACALIAGVRPAVAAVRLGMPFSDHLVLQAQTPTPIWGTASAGERVSVECAGQTAATIADDAGQWRVTLPPLPASDGAAGQTLRVRGAESDIVLRDVLIGEVWLCSGQSNMRFTLGRQAEPRDATAPLLYPESLAGCAHPRIRLLNVSGGTPAERRWAACGPDTAAQFSAIGYFFGAALERARNVPVGLIDLGMGGASIRTFLPRSAFSSRPDFGRAFPPEKRPGFANGGVFERDVMPLAPFAVRGVLWYQGESDAGRAALYPELLQTMIAEWRRVFAAPDLPFLIVQLPPWERRRTDPPKKSPGLTWAELREAQAKVVANTSHTAIVVIADYGERLDIHPRRKREVGERLACVARARVYGEALPSSGPTLETVAVGPAAITLQFRHCEGGLLARGEQLTDFEVAGEDGQFVPAAARIIGYNRLVVTPPAGVTARSVRYAWCDYFEPSLLNGHGWPAAPFRTDSLPRKTAAAPAAARGP